MNKIYVLVMQLAGIILLSLILLVLSSCASQKDSTKVIKEVKDSVAMMLTDTVNKTIDRKYSTDMAFTDTQHEVSGITAYLDGQEKIRERIVEVTDEKGNTTMTTDRTTSRSFSLSTQKAIEQWQKHNEEQHTLLLSRIDSIATSRVEATITSHEKNDSTHNDTHINAPRPASWLDTIRQRLVDYVFCALLILGVIIVVKKNQG